MKSGSFLERSLVAGKFVVTAEIMPPKTPSAKVISKKTTALKGVITAANLTDNQSAMVRLASLAASKIVLDAGIEPIMQVTCRDRNRLAIQSDVIGASALGIQNVLCVTGDHQKFGNHTSAKNVYDMDSMHVIRMLRKMRDEGCYFNDEPIRNRAKGNVKPPSLFIGAAANPFAYPRNFRPYRLLKKIDSGADFVQTQPVYDLEVFKAWYHIVSDLGLHEQTFILAGITPVKSARALIYMRDNVPGMHIPEHMIKRMETCADPEKEGLEMAMESIEKIRELPGIRGIHLMAIGWEKIVAEIVHQLKIYPELDD